MEYTYFAFVSYNTNDQKWGERLVHKLEDYKLPKKLCKKHGWKNRKPLGPNFFAPFDIQPGPDLDDEIKGRLGKSKYLIVICSPNSAQSEWVGKEIKYFKEDVNRGDNVYFFIVDGIPKSGDPKTESFHPVIAQLGYPNPHAANVHEKIYRCSFLNEERAYVQLITKLLGIQFDEIWNRRQRDLFKKILIRFLFILFFLGCLLYAVRWNEPVNVLMRLNEITPVNILLPKMRNAMVTLKLDNEERYVEFQTINDKMVLRNVPANLIGKRVGIKFDCQDFLPLDTTLILKDELVINISRDVNAFGHITFTLYNHDSKPIINQPIDVEGIKTVTDSCGKVNIVIPIELQKHIYRIKSNIALEDSIIDAKLTETSAVFAK